MNTSDLEFMSLLELSFQVKLYDLTHIWKFEAKKNMLLFPWALIVVNYIMKLIEFNYMCKSQLSYLLSCSEHNTLLRSKVKFGHWSLQNSRTMQERSKFVVLKKV